MGKICLAHVLQRGAQPADMAPAVVAIGPGGGRAELY